MLMNNLTGQTKLLFIKKDGHPNTVLHKLCPQLLGPVNVAFENVAGSIRFLYR